MSTTPLSVGSDVVVGIAYELRLQDGDLIDASELGEPLEFIFGHQSVIPGLEAELLGMKVGEAKDVVVAPGEGYGDIDPEDFVLVPHDAFLEDVGLSEGMQLSLRDPDSDETFEGIVTEIRDDGVLVDLNHPLAGETLYFNVEIVSLREATASEMSHGHVHHHGNDH